MLWLFIRLNISIFIFIKLISKILKLGQSNLHISPSLEVLLILNWRAAFESLVTYTKKYYLNTVLLRLSVNIGFTGQFYNFKAMSRITCRSYIICYFNKYFLSARTIILSNYLFILLQRAEE
jgi:hypothetical protein